MTSAVRFVMAFRSDAGGLALLGRRSGSVRRSAFVPDGRDGRTELDAHNLISKPHDHSVPDPPYTPYTTELVVAGLKQY